MISRIRNSTSIKFLWGLMGLYLLNISVDTADLNPEHIPEDLSFNDQESMVEIVIEQILGFENAIKEYEDHDTEENNKKKNVKVELLILRTKTNENDYNQFTRSKKLYPDYNARLTNGFKEIVSPPPKI